jgi:hypothetical protein
MNTTFPEQYTPEDIREVAWDIDIPTCKFGGNLKIRRQLWEVSWEFLPSKVESLIALLDRPIVQR